ncbi:unnamed protein product [Phytophthora fragariaefolia]|uniref:Unnamed protein product n=1 Tax=Phytophthora fragariaefolia TaxID=1490495 RepID=A0A9W6Y535_9STRA|nr:unnamed protein product [Phytophthora fragariaefolia]
MARSKARKKARKTTAVSDTCFRLLRLTPEIQTGTKVLKAVVDEVDVLRLCRSLGMAVSNEGDSASMHEFEFGMFDASDYDSDFARFIREKLAGGNKSSTQQEEDQEGEEMLEIGCLFGKQLEVKAELSYMGLWSSDCEDGLHLHDQGVYCLEQSGGRGNRRQFVVFAWLDAHLFNPKRVRDIPAYVLRFLITLSPSVTCCLSEEDFSRIKTEVNDMAGASSSRWKSCSVAFRVQKQVEKQDNISCGDVAALPIPISVHGQSFWFVGGVFPAIAVESAAPSTTEWVTQNEVIPCSTFADWLMQKAKSFTISLPNTRSIPDAVQNDLLKKFGQFPDKELSSIQKKFEEQLDEATVRIERETFEYAKKIYDDAVQDISMLFAVPSSATSSEIDLVHEQYQQNLYRLDEFGFISSMDYQVYKMLYLPERIQAHMTILGNVFQRDHTEFLEVLNKIIAGDPVKSAVNEDGWFGKMYNVIRWVYRPKIQFTDSFRLAMEEQLPMLQNTWMDAVHKFVSLVQSATFEERVQQFTKDHELQSDQEEKAAKRRAFIGLCEHLQVGDKYLKTIVSRMMLTSDQNAIKLEWREQVEKKPTKVIRIFKLPSNGPDKMSLMGTIELEPGLELCKVSTVKLDQAVSIIRKENTTIVRRAQFPLRPDLSEVKTEKFDIRTFPRACSLCSVRAADRRVAFLFGGCAERLGSVAFCRFNKAFTSVEVTLSIDMDASFGLAGPLIDILLTERSLCAVGANGDMQSFDIRTRRTSKKVACGAHNDDKSSTWVGGLLNFADELVIGRAKLGSNQRLSLSSMSSEDHRSLPTVVIEASLTTNEITTGSIGDVLYVVDPGKNTVYASQLSVTVRSDAYRVQRSGANGARNNDQGCLQADQKAKYAAVHWLRVFYHAFEKFPVRSLIDMSMNPGAALSLELEIGVIKGGDRVAASDGPQVCVAYFNHLMVDLQRLNKPLSGLNFTKKLKFKTCEEETRGRIALQAKSIRHALIAVVSFVPVQICCAEDNMLKLLQDGEGTSSATKGTCPSSSEHETWENATDASEIAQSIRFGLLSPLLESWSGRCVVVTSMGKQTTGKSYFLNHLAGTSFAISGSRCTDGAWMSLRFVSPHVLLVVLDFEGLGSFERSEQEDIFLSVLNASVSLFTVFRMESRFDKDLVGLFSRFQKGVQLIKNDSRLFRGLLYMSVKDVNMDDRQGVVDELVTKLESIFEANKDQNFLTEMYAGQLEINCSPPFGTMDYYHCMENDAARSLCEVVSPPAGKEPTGFVTGKSFLDCLRIVLAKISILDWTSMDKSTRNLLIADVKQKIPGMLRTGCLISLPLVADNTIPLHLKEDALQIGSSKKIIISMKELCEANPGYALKWVTLNDTIPLNGVTDEAIDLGFDVTTITSTSVVMVQKTISALFKFFLTLLGKKYGGSRLTTDDQSAFDSFVAFVILRRKMKIVRWLRGMLGESLSEVRAQLEQIYADPLPVYLSRCQQKCACCQLGCMNSVTHSPGIEHSCCTNHKCLGWCEYGECRAPFDSMQVPPCSRSAGHEGKCECEKGEHTCGQPCLLAKASNCDKTCCKRAEHSGDHLCSVQVHTCGAKCSAAICTATCLLDIQRKHSAHKCAEVRCLHSCLMNGCTNTCAEKDHFHGQSAKSRTFANESGMASPVDLTEALDDGAPVAHMCAGSHACPEICQIDGICEQKVHLKKSARTYTGARGSFEYIYQEMNGCKKPCTHVLPSGEKHHEGVDHSCLAQEDSDQNTVHYCDVRCPSCSYYCNKHFGHLGLHATSHGNMQQTYFMAKTNNIDIEDRKYQVGERGIAEMCNLFCSKMGRGHYHYLSCESNADESCVYTADASTDHRRHCVDELFPPPGRDMDELLHDQFWSTIGWEDPCNEEERAVFAKCRFQCNAPEHDGCDEVPSFCVLDAWHKPEPKAEGADDGFAYVDGHKFECVHVVDTGKFHSIFVLDSSGSMSGQPWQDLLCACSEFGISRLEDGGENDLASYVTFDHESHIVCEGEPLPGAMKMSVPFSGGGTSFTKGLRAANEVLSRNNFEEFKAVLIFFSDGQPCDIDSGITLAQHIRSTYAKYDLKAFAVGFGYVNLSVLQRVAKELGGEYRQVLDANALRTEFKRIAAVLCNSEASLALLDSGVESA